MKKFRLFGMLCFLTAIVRLLICNLVPFADFDLWMASSSGLMIIGAVLFLLSALNAKGISTFARVVQFLVVGVFVVGVILSILGYVLQFSTSDFFNYFHYPLTFLLCMTFLYSCRFHIVWKIFISLFETVGLIFSYWGFETIVDVLEYPVQVYSLISAGFAVPSLLFWLLAFVTYPAKYWKE